MTASTSVLIYHTTRNICGLLCNIESVKMFLTYNLHIINPQVLSIQFYKFYQLCTSMKQPHTQKGIDYFLYPERYIWSLPLISALQKQLLFWISNFAYCWTSDRWNHTIGLLLFLASLHSFLRFIHVANISSGQLC